MLLMGKKKKPDSPTDPATQMERDVAEREAVSASLPRRRAHGTGTPGAYGAEVARRNFAEMGADRSPLNDVRRAALRDVFASRARVPDGVPVAVAASARTCAAETALRAYEDEWDRLLAEGRAGQ